MEIQVRGRDQQPLILHPPIIFGPKKHRMPHYCDQKRQDEACLKRRNYDILLQYIVSHKELDLYILICLYVFACPLVTLSSVFYVGFSTDISSLSQYLMLPPVACSIVLDRTHENDSAWFGNQGFFKKFQQFSTFLETSF